MAHLGEAVQQDQRADRDAQQQLPRILQGLST
jgi:hypothetical protein